MEGEQNKQAETKEPAKVPVSHPYYVALFLNELDTIKKAPVSFVLVAGLFSFLGWYVTSFAYDKFILPGMNAQIDDWQVKASVVGIANDGWPPLDNKDVLQFAQALSQFKVSKFEVLWAQEIDAARFFRSLQAVGKADGFTVESSGGNAGSSGINLYANPDDPCGKVIADFLNSHGYQTKITPITGNRDPSQAGVYEFFIGDKP